MFETGIEIADGRLVRENITGEWKKKNRVEGEMRVRLGHRQEGKEGERCYTKERKGIKTMYLYYINTYGRKEKGKEEE
jgi:hypothetical protein